VNGVISTRSANGAALRPITGKSLSGKWELALPNQDDHFRDEMIEDILFVITFSGDSPPWPE
jgi:hypothetical protein